MHVENSRLKDLALVLLEIGAQLMSSGASTARVRLTLNRISDRFGCRSEVIITNRALMLTIHTDDNSQSFSSGKRISLHGINFRMVSGISRMSWRALEEAWDLDKIRAEVERLKSLPNYPRWLVLTMVGLAGAAFCRLFGGHAIEMMISFLATVAGLFVRQETLRKNFNPYLCVFFASATASLLAGAAVRFGLGISPELAFTASVLFLVPGVPLITSVSDLLDGNMLNGLSRGVNAFLISFAIALGLLTAMIIYSIHVWNGF